MWELRGAYTNIVVKIRLNVTIYNMGCEISGLNIDLCAETEQCNL